MGNNTKRIEVTDPETGEVFGLNVGMLVGDIRDTLISKRRNQIMATTWSKLSENDQRDEIRAATTLAEDLVTAVVDMVAAAGHDVIHARLDNFKIKDGAVTVTAKGAADDGALLALNHVGLKNLKIVVADAEKFDQQREALEPQKDQESMFPDGDDDAGPETDSIDDPDDLHEPEPEQAVETLTDARIAGYQARMDGHPSSSSPHDIDTFEREEWYLGWKEADGDDGAPSIVDDVDEPEVSSPDPIEDDGAEFQADDAPDLGGLTIEQHGQQACLKEQGLDDNPFDGGTDEHAEWRFAFEAAAEEVAELIEAGRKAGESGEPKKSCPWKKGSDGERFWLKGWTEGSAAS